MEQGADIRLKSLLRRDTREAGAAMQIDWVHFTPWSALAGGVLMGVAVVLLLLAEGRILGVSGIFGGLLPPRRGDTLWRLLLLAGLIASPWLAGPLFGAAAPSIETSAPSLIIGGLLVGFGTRLSNGCTSGHGVCGLARLSPRSLVATLCFMGAGALTVFVMRHVLG
jgi:uncharacterized protein